MKMSFDFYLFLRPALFPHPVVVHLPTLSAGHLSEQLSLVGISFALLWPKIALVFSNRVKTGS